MAATVYNKNLIYQHKVFLQLQLFCETYLERYAYDRRDPPRAQAEHRRPKRVKRSCPGATIIPEARQRDNISQRRQKAGRWRRQYAVEAVLKPGQYVLIRVTAVSWAQWHPFTVVASSPPLRAVGRAG